MGPNSTQALILVLFASILGVGIANKDWQLGGWGPKRGYHRPGHKDTPQKIIVGGSANWTFGFNYSVWAFKSGPFFVNDTLVFKYDPPSETNIHPHSVYLLPDMWSFINCNLTRGVKIANETQGAGKGFEFVLKEWKPYYFACGASDGYHCNVGRMKFFVLPYLRRWY
ncbi:uncharacterized protein LOC110605577 [Manihot esculenta]|uniref:Phytocyanin domain-containing protein n=1 Tax=Manihot esculenta TaxID=3983 RepID=A0A2C9U653_MANES|nr:uncharacterized protein LOC110605577 [Manihot esculenta]OAY25433.1 hypothetical protein MANES_17G094200v8 [Manihot esculenta]